ncbi:putative F-box domain, FBD domain, leucine-rich repeat domain superfamily [Helianthus annuus]|nr:putative F-box domain, FBD domain, leucine-rich repeat domain superfamily [Helianthus annuus]KAJ0562059.1 putative F-box domain, FBD domain, leucine-rich repeat domain superfamily [Helianthus annuus]
MDRISKLPLCIIEAILCFLPIQEAARTSILSKEWRYHWIKIPKLAFIEDTFQVSTEGDELSILEQTFYEPSDRKVMTKRCKLFGAIYQVLLLHQGPIHEFTLSMVVDDSCVEIDHIILHLSKKNTLKILNLDLRGNYSLPSSFFSLHYITELYITSCVFDRQPSSNGFRSLTTLNLQEIWISEKALMRLLSSCPLLKTLTIMSDYTTIDVFGDFTIADFIECLPNIEYLSVWFSIFLLPSTTLVHLKYLCMEWIWLRHKYAVPFLVHLIRSFPNLEKLKLELSVDDDLFDEFIAGSITFDDYSDIMLEHLNELEILHFSDADNELDFVKLILAKSPVLKKVRILLWDEIDEDERLRISQILLRSPCVSPVVKFSVS